MIELPDTKTAITSDEKCIAILAIKFRYGSNFDIPKEQRTALIKAAGCFQT
jgi:hypothetical protein